MILNFKTSSFGSNSWFLMKHKCTSVITSSVRVHSLREVDDFESFPAMCGRVIAIFVCIHVLFDKKV